MYVRRFHSTFCRITTAALRKGRWGYLCGSVCVRMYVQISILYVSLPQSFTNTIWYSLSSAALRVLAKSDNRPMD